MNYLEYLIVSTHCKINDTNITLAGLTAASALKGEQVGVVAVAPQAQVGPPDVVPPVRVEHELGLRQLHHA